MQVVEAYLSPTVDDSAEPFTWGTPDTDGLKQYPFALFGSLGLLTDSGNVNQVVTGLIPSPTVFFH